LSLICLGGEGRRTGINCWRNPFVDLERIPQLL
jgi:hypothetical protein